MPEFPSKSRQIKLPTGHSSGTETSAAESSGIPTPRSDVSTDNDTKSKDIKKTFKSAGSRNIKKNQLKVSTYAKSGRSYAKPQLNAFNGHNKNKQLLKSVLNPTQATNSLALQRTISLPPSMPLPKPLAGAIIVNSFADLPKTDFVRQPTGFLKFSLRKSISQMDFKEARRTGKLATVTTTRGVGGISRNISNPIKFETESKMIVSNIINQESSFYYMPDEQDQKFAGMRIFGSIMLNAWRKRRDEVKRLNIEIHDLKHSVTKNKNQLHVISTMYRVEQHHNADMQHQIKGLTDDTKTTKETITQLEQTSVSLKEDIVMLKEEIKIKDNDLENTNLILNQTKTDLFKAMSLQRDLQSNLSIEQRRYQLLETQKNDLEIELINMRENSNNLEKINAELNNKIAELDEANKQIEKLQLLIEKLKETEVNLRLHEETEIQLKKEKELLQIEIKNLTEQMTKTFNGRFKAMWSNTIGIKRFTMQFLHLLLYTLLPATPPPKIQQIPFTVTLEKALSFVKH